MQSKVPKGLATWAGIIAAAGQYALSIALFLDAFEETDPTAGIAPLVTATATLWKVIEGRMEQAKAITEARAFESVNTPKYMVPGVMSAGLQQAAAVKPYMGSGTNVVSTFTAPRPGAEMTTYDPGGRDTDAPDLSVQPPDPTFRSPELDDPGYEPPSREQHSRLKG